MAKYYRFGGSQTLFYKMAHEDNWRKDTFFVQQRLAGMNPLGLKAVTLDGKPENII